MTLQDSQVLQRGTDGRARVALDSGEVLDLPTGGPYEVGGAKDIYVGDLWVLAGQSNMEGVGMLDDVEAPHPLVRSFQSREQWAVAEEPLHYLGESPRAVHHDGGPVPETIPPRDPTRTWGAGLGLTFAREMIVRTNVPIGLIPSAHGGTSMDQWSPSRKGQGGASLYGATLERVRANGGKVAGILWYQGESDANSADAALYRQRMTELVQSFRADFGQPDLPFYYVQLNGVIADAHADGIFGWNSIRESQRVLQKTLPHVSMVSAIDLGYDDGIHIDTAGLKTLGRRLALVASGHPAPELQSVTLEPFGGFWFRLRVAYTNVQGGLRSPGRPTGFSLRDAEGNDLPLICKVTLDGSDVLLKVTDPDRLPGATLYYGWGFNTYCNITDAAGASVPAFGPIPVG